MKAVKPNSSRVVKKANRHLVFSTIRDSESLSVEELVRITRLSRPTVLKLLSELEQDKIVEKTGLGESMGGRQPMLYALNCKHHFAIGVDFEFPPMRVVFSDIKGNVVYSRRWEHYYSDSEVDVLNKILTYIKGGIKTLKIGKENIIGIGMGIPGLVDINYNKPIGFARIPGAKEFLINTMIEEELGIPTHIRNDAHLLALADRDTFKDISQSVLYIAYRTGIGMAIFENGILYDGDCGNAGYLGHTMFDRDGDVCYCGRKGCLELYCSKISMLRKYNKLTGHSEELTFQALLGKANEGEPVALRIVNESAVCFGLAIANAIKLFDISLVVIGDLPPQAIPIFLKVIEETANNNVTYCKNGKVSILHGKVEESAYALGGCILVLDKFFKTPKLQLEIG